MNVSIGLLLAVFVTPTISAAADLPSVCPPVIPFDTSKTIKGGVSASLISKILSSIGLTGEYHEEAKARLPTEDDRAGAVQGLAIVCAWLDRDTTIPTAQKIELLRAWVITMMTYSGKTSENIYKMPILAAFNVGESNVRTRLFNRPAIVEVAATDNVILRPPPPPPAGATILKVFPKSNLGLESILRLRTLLPDFDIRQGRSSLSGSRYPAEVLFVDRDKVSERSVVRVLRALHELGVPIKSVQQSSLAKGVQVGTFSDEGVMIVLQRPGDRATMTAALVGEPVELFGGQARPRGELTQCRERGDGKVGEGRDRRETRQFQDRGHPVVPKRPEVFRSDQIRCQFVVGGRIASVCQSGHADGQGSARPRV